MPNELSYILITPYTILKSRTGGVIARLLSRSDIELVATQMIAPSQELANEYAEGLLETVGRRNKQASQWFYDYVLRTFSPTSERPHRVMMLVFKGKNAAKKLFEIAGELITDSKSAESSITGETIRDTYADLVISRSTGRVRYFEPAVLTPPSASCALRRLKMFSDFADSESNIVENITYDTPENVERTLVIIKPDNWRYPSSKPGNIIDMFSRTGLRIIGCKVYQMSVSEALEFYGPVKDVLREKLSPIIAKQAKAIVEKEFNINIDGFHLPAIADSIGKTFSDGEFSKIIEFMSGTKPEDCPVDELNSPGKVKCMVLIYEGIDAVNKIRTVLGPTDPTKAPSGTIRKEFGESIMINTAHASDSAENAKREMRIVKVQENKLGSIIKEYLKSGQ
jgi:nucleoside diphosphate kinase